MKRRQASPRAAKRAEEIIEDLRIFDAAEIDLELIAAHFKAFVRFRHLRNQQGHILRRGPRAVIVVRSELRDRPRGRWVVAHELGHYLLHEGVDQYKACTSADLADYRSSGHEPEANQFAAELLMPTKLFRPDSDRSRPDLEDVKELAEKYGTSLTATAIRLAKFSPEPCAAVLSRGGRILLCSRSTSWRYFVRNGHELSTSSYAGDIFAGKSVPTRPVSVEASAWTTSEWATDHDLREHSMALGRTGDVLSMLWAPEL